VYGGEHEPPARFTVISRAEVTLSAHSQPATAHEPSPLGELSNLEDTDAFTRIFEGLLEAASQFSNYRLPELFAGFWRTEYESPVPYPVACRPQAWAAGAIPYSMQCGFGLTAEGFDRRLRIVRPSLPRWINRVAVPDITLAGARIDLRFERAGDGVMLADAQVDGGAEVAPELAGDEAAARPIGP
jgi:hypothetical protein